VIMEVTTKGNKLYIEIELQAEWPRPAKFD
jgi:hypothetical protein